jgi:transcriptional regulator with XRE-family HTH domain
LTACSVILYTPLLVDSLASKSTPTAVASRQTSLGERVRELRTEAGLSVRALAATAGFSPSFISQVENGQASPSISSLERLASALGVSLSRVFGDGWSDSMAVVRAGDRRTLSSARSRERIEALAPDHAGGSFEAVMITISPGGRSGPRSPGHPGEVLAVCFSGSVTLSLHGSRQVLSRGDSVTFSSATPHRWENRGDEVAQILIVSPRFSH